MFTKLVQRVWHWRTPECCRRKTDGGATYKYWGRNFIFDVDEAIRLVQDGRTPVEVEDESVRISVEMSRICPEHVAHVDVTRPGIIAHVQCLADDGELIEGQVLIDGNHRAARSLELQRPFLAFLLTEEESKSILIREPTQTFAKVQEAATSDTQSQACGV